MCVSVIMNDGATAHEMAAGGVTVGTARLADVPCSRNTGAGQFNEQRRPCGLNSLICCHRTYDDSILGSVLLCLLHLLDKLVSKPVQM